MPLKYFIVKRTCFELVEFEYQNVETFNTPVSGGGGGGGGGLL